MLMFYKEEDDSRLAPYKSISRRHLQFSKKIATRVSVKE